jgi:hypothetical protein
LLLLGDAFADQEPVVGQRVTAQVERRPDVADRTVLRSGRAHAHPVWCVDARGVEDLSDDLGLVRSMVGKGFAGPLPRHEDPATTDAQVPPIVSFGWALARHHPGCGLFRLDAEPEPVRTPGRARQKPDVPMEPVQMGPLRRCEVVGVAVGVGDVFGQVLR